MKESGAVKRLKAFAKQSTVKTSPSEFFASLDQESDRGVVILATTVLEDSLVEALRSNMAGLSDKEFENICSYNNLAGSFGSRIVLAHALQVISNEIRDVLDFARHLRNACAHARSAMDFNTEEVRSVVALMFPGPGSEPPSQWTAAKMRSLFISNCVVTSQVITGKMPMTSQDFDGSEIMKAMAANVLKSLPGWFNDDDRPHSERR